MTEEERAPAQGDAGRTQRDVFSGFEGYRTATDDDYAEVLTRGLVVPDTNVLLNLYRYNEQARVDLIGVLGRLGEQLWVPHQVLVEFWRNREGALRDPGEAADAATEELDTQQQLATKSLRTWANRVALEAERLTELQRSLDEAFVLVRQAIAGAVQPEAMRQALDTNADPVLTMLGPVLTEHIGDPMAPDTRAAAVAEGRRRSDARIPPGYMDAAKSKHDDEDASAGDYLVWEQLLREAERRACDVLIVTGDVKEDWWRRVQGEARGPRLELAEELRARSGGRLFMLRPESLLVHARRVLEVDVREESLRDVERVERFASSRDLGGWTPHAVQQLMERLGREAPVQADAIRRAATQGGFVSREEVYNLGGYEATRTLRGFTRPANRLAQEFRDRGVIPLTAVDILEAVYDPTFSWVTARGFRIPQQLASMIGDETEGS